MLSLHCAPRISAMLELKTKNISVTASFLTHEDPGAYEDIQLGAVLGCPNALQRVLATPSLPYWIEHCPLKIHIHLEPQNVTFFRNSALQI